MVYRKNHVSKNYAAQPRTPHTTPLCGLSADIFKITASYSSNYITFEANSSFRFNNLLSNAKQLMTMHSKENPRLKSK